MFHTYKRERPVINLSALIDVLFILLIFVILAANFDKTRAIDVTLPRGGVAATAPADAVIVVVPVRGPMRVNGETVDERELETALRKLAPHRSSLVLAADGVVSLERAAAILTVARRVGFTTVSIATGTPTGPSEASSGDRSGDTANRPGVR